ncbi:MAG: hypothetical protein RMX96_11665 [Nostoc sp. ChiSLP02]|nr:hypothetical protein [Nostoc sp. DedSLP01]MDZ8185498.1 hypothetical protein [Nostoc sp. ChiSLP02]
MNKYNYTKINTPSLVTITSGSSGAIASLEIRHDKGNNSQT